MRLFTLAIFFYCFMFNLYQRRCHGIKYPSVDAQRAHESKNRLRFIRNTSCGGTFTSLNGSFTSPDYPSEYPNDCNCQFLITLPLGYHIQLLFVDFYVEPDYDFVYVYDGADTSADTIGSYTGSQSSLLITSSINNLFIVFESDSAVSYRGFTASYTSYRQETTPASIPHTESVTTPASVPHTESVSTLHENTHKTTSPNTASHVTERAPCTNDQFTCESSKLCIATSSECDGDNDCIDGSDERNCSLTSNIIVPIITVCGVSVGLVIAVVLFYCNFKKIKLNRTTPSPPIAGPPVTGSKTSLGMIVID
ncbi:uncharacterized protein LOC100366935 [Saccoglossus kowalevskii]|uniref:CUB and sushi domain-containing protein 1-like n=1 Tax=Saccoglossus kowalevskii TaxID=10224 RepID=A0ABM0MR68_SACKO|nr:PREDICTED: CUB and sushi domain-containing protein 1-like [Saccoglossus kowalevskii]